MATHKKHPKLPQPKFGCYARNEWAIVGTACNKIQRLAAQVISALGAQYHCAYLDADHRQADADPNPPGLLPAGALLEYTDAIHSHRFQYAETPNTHRFRQIFNEMDLVLVNGNHHPAAVQVVVIDPDKENSLKKRLDQLTDVRLILLSDGVTQPFDFLPGQLTDNVVPILSFSDTQGIIQFFKREMEAAQAPLNALVLAGGESLRMGRDKSLIDWHGKAQREFLADELSGLCREVFISCRAEQQADIDSAYPTLPDTFTGLGPFGAILSAFRRQPDAAWLVVACDMPLLQRATFEYLIAQRSVKHLATAFQNPDDGLPEPLITIWEPKSYNVLLSFLAQGYSCPRKVLIQSGAKLITAPDPHALTNVNTPEELEKLSAHGN